MRNPLKTLSTFIILTVVVSVFCFSSFSEETKPRLLPLEDFITLASKNDANFEEILIDELKLKYKRLLTMPARDLVLSLKSQYDVILYKDRGNIENTVSLSKLFPLTGTEISAEYETSLNSSTYKVSSEFSAMISQPIARNAFGRNAQLLDKIMGLEVDIANYQIVEAYEDYLAALIQMYYNWYSAYENVKTAENSYNENLKLLENIKERQKYKIALPVDVNKISLQVAAKKEALVSLENKYTEYLNMVKESIRYDSVDKLEPGAPSTYEHVAIDFEPDHEMFVKKSRTIKVLGLLEDKSSLEVDKYADELLPSIDIIAGYSRKGAGHDIVDNEETVYAGMSMDWPLPGEVEQATYQDSKIDLKKTKLSTENVSLRLNTNLKNLYNQIEREKELISLAQEKVDLATSIVEDDRKNYSLGRLTLNDLIDEVNKLENNKFNKIFHEIELKRLTMEWLRLTDQLVKENRINYKKSNNKL